MTNQQGCNQFFQFLCSERFYQRHKYWTNLYYNVLITKKNKKITWKQKLKKISQNILSLFVLWDFPRVRRGLPACTVRVISYLSWPPDHCIACFGFYCLKFWVLKIIVCHSLLIHCSVLFGTNAITQSKNIELDFKFRI